MNIYILKYLYLTLHIIMKVVRRKPLPYMNKQLLSPRLLLHEMKINMSNHDQSSVNKAIFLPFCSA